MTVLKKYSDLLPQYLRGPNISRHAEIIEAQDKKVYEKIELLRLWNIPERPVLIQRLQPMPGVAFIIVHVNSPYPVQKLTIEREGSTDIVVEYDEDELKTQFTYSYTQQGTGTVITPMCTVTVETYEGITYKKGYPENVEVQGDVCDHDEFLDLLGKLLGLPRRRYKEVTISQDSQYSQLVPAFFLGSLEDDYYYAVRLRHLMDNYQTSELLPLMGELLYEMHNPFLFNLIGRTTVTEETEDYLGENVMALGLQEQYLNIDYSNIVEVLSQYMNLTRLLIFVHSAVSRLSFVEVGDCYPNYVPFKSLLEYSYDNTEWLPLEGAPVWMGFYTGDTYDFNYLKYNTFNTTPTGEVIHAWGGMPPGQREIPIKAKYEEPYEIEDSTYTHTETVTIGNDLLISTGAWSYGNSQSYTGTPVPPFMEDDILNVGRGVITNTPVTDNRLCDLDAYTVSMDFHFTTTTQYVAIGRSAGKTGRPDIIVPKELCRIYPRQYEAHDRSISETHNVTWKYLDKVCYLYYDDIYTGIHTDYTVQARAIQYIFAYSGVSNTDNSLKIESVTVDDTVDISTAPTGSLDVLDTYNIDKWASIQSSSPSTAPSVSNDGYDIGDHYNTVFQDYIIEYDTRNKVVEIEFNTDYTKSFRLGLARYNGTGNPSWGGYFSASTDATFSTGNHILEFRCDGSGNWTTYLDDTRTSTASFTLTEGVTGEYKVTGNNFTSGKHIRILGVRVYDNNE